MSKQFQANFDNFRIDINQGVFHKNGEKVNLRPKEFAVLWLLVQRAGELVSKEHIIKEVWRGLPTSDESIARCISVVKNRLRAASPGADFLIKTEYGRGYRFVGNISLALERRIHKSLKKTVIKPTTVGEIASKDILSCQLDMSIYEAASLLSAKQKSSILVLSDRRPIGIWTEADVLKLNLADTHVLDIKLGDVMQSPVISLEEWQPISEAVTLMRHSSIRHLVVVDKSGYAIGVLTQSDIIYSHGVESFMTVKDVKSIAFQKPLVVTENIPVSEIVSQMQLHNTDIIVIQLQDHELFCVTERDIIDLIAHKCLNVLVGNIKIQALARITEDTSILVARQIMDAKKIKHLAILGIDGKFNKILSLSDILADIEHSYGQLVGEILEEKKKIPESEGYIKLLANAMQQTAGMMIITDKHGDIEFANDAFEKISGYRLDEIKGKNPRFLSSGLISKTVFKDMWQTLMSGNNWKGELHNVKKSGEHYWVLSSITPIIDDNNEISHFIAVEEDISERKAVEMRLLEIEQRFYEVVHHSSIMIWESDPNGKVIFLNKYWLEFTGRNLPEQISNGWIEQLHPDDLQVFLEAFQHALIRRDSFCLDHRLKNAEGEYRWVMNLGMPRFDDNERFMGFRGTCVDITERKRQELDSFHSAHHKGNVFVKQIF